MANPDAFGFPPPPLWRPTLKIRAKKEEENTRDYLSTLPSELIGIVLCFLSVDDLFGPSIQLVSRRLFGVFRDPPPRLKSLLYDLRLKALGSIIFPKDITKADVANDITCLEISPVNECLYSGSQDGLIRVWNKIDGTLLQTIEGHSQEVTCLAISPKDGRVYSGSGCTIRVWSGEDGTFLQTFEEQHTQDITCLAISPADGRVFSGSYDAKILVWSGTDGAFLSTIRNPSGVTCLAISSNNDRLYSGTVNGHIIVWNLTNGQHIMLLVKQDYLIRCLAISPKYGRVYGVTSGSSTHIQAWSDINGAPLQTFVGHSSAITCLAVSPKNGRVYSGSDDTVNGPFPDGSIFEWDEELMYMYGEELLEMHSDNTIRVWDGVSGDLIQTLEAHTEGITALTIGGDGRIYSGSSDGTILIW